MKIYVASSWRNPYQENVVGILRNLGHEVYDFQHPPGGDQLGFAWSDVDPDWRNWTPAMYRRALQHPIAVAGFESDFAAMQWADACVLVLPCNRSAHLEAGWFVGAGKSLYILLDDADPDWHTAGDRHAVTELMYRMATAIWAGLDELVRAMRREAA